MLVLAWLCMAGCEGKKKSVDAPPPQPASCTADLDCSDRWMCLAGRCTDPSSAAIYSDPANAITPEKVGREVEQIGQQHERDIDKALDVE